MMLHKAHHGSLRSVTLVRVWAGRVELCPTRRGGITTDGLSQDRPLSPPSHGSLCWVSSPRVCVLHMGMSQGFLQQTGCPSHWQPNSRPEAVSGSHWCPWVGGWVAAGTSLVIWDLTQQNSATLLAVRAAGGLPTRAAARLNRRRHRLSISLGCVGARWHRVKTRVPCPWLNGCIQVAPPYPPAWGQQFNAIKKDL